MPVVALQVVVAVRGQGDFREEVVLVLTLGIVRHETQAALDHIVGGDDHLAGLRGYVELDNQFDVAVDLGGGRFQVEAAKFEVDLVVACRVNDGDPRDRTDVAGQVQGGGLCRLAHLDVGDLSDAGRGGIGGTQLQGEPAFPVGEDLFLRGDRSGGLGQQVAQEEQGHVLTRDVVAVHRARAGDLQQDRLILLAQAAVGVEVIQGFDLVGQRVFRGVAQVALAFADVGAGFEFVEVHLAAAKGVLLGFIRHRYSTFSVGSIRLTGRVILIGM